MGMYQKIPEPVMAFKWMGPEISLDKQFPPIFKPEIVIGEQECPSKYWLETKSRMVLINVGDYIIKDRNGYYDKVRPEEFARLYTPITNS